MFDEIGERERVVEEKRRGKVCSWREVEVEGGARDKWERGHGN